MMKRTQVQAILLMAVGALARLRCGVRPANRTSPGPSGFASYVSPPSQRSPSRPLAQRGRTRDRCWPTADAPRLGRRVIPSRRRTERSRTSS